MYLCYLLGFLQGDNCVIFALNLEEYKLNVSKIVCTAEGILVRFRN